MTAMRFGIGLSALLAVLVVTGIIAEAQGRNTSNAVRNKGVVTKPFKISGGGDGPLGIVFDPMDPEALTFHNATGTATHLGNYTTRDGMFTTQTFDLETLVGEFEGSVVFVAANGDELKFDYHASADPDSDGTGRFYGAPADENDPTNTDLIVTFIQEFTPVPEESTGRFAKVTGGSFIMIATSEPVAAPYFGVPFAYTWVGEGTLEFAKGNK